MSKLYLMEAPLNLRNMARWAAEAGHSDPDRTAHCLITESFGPDMAPKPFVIKTEIKNGEPDGKVLAYTRYTAQELAERAERCQKLAHAAVLNSEAIRTVSVPAQWKKGKKLSFEIRVRPTKRQSERGQKDGEQDYFLNAPPGSKRAEVYCRWLADILQRQGALQPDLADMQMIRFAFRRIKRQPSSRWHTGPDVTIAGTATVINPEGVEEVLARGIGRHKGYGYGMLLIRPRTGV